MSFIQSIKSRKRNGELRIIGAFSMDLKSMPDEVRPNPGRMKRVQIVYGILKEFCTNSSIHGVRYFTKRNIHWFEKVWWMIAFWLSVTLCFFSIWNIWMKWQTGPVIVSFDDKATSIGMIPFPAVTICSTKKVAKKIDYFKYEKALYSLKRNYKKFDLLTPEEMGEADAILHICFKEFPSLNNMFTFRRPKSIYKFIEELSPDIGSVILLPLFFNQLVRFKPIFTANGLCYTFNSLNSNEIFTDEVDAELLTVKNNPNSSWKIEGGYDSNVNENDVYPNRVFGANVWRDSLSAILGITIDETNRFCSNLAQGFRLSLHTPNELPQLPDTFVFIPVNEEMYISIQPKMITTSKGLSTYSPGERGCYFKSERKLRFFREYSQQKCGTECLSNFTKSKCGCVQFHMPRDRHTKVCTMVKISCYNNANMEYSQKHGSSQCNCLPSCTAITYELQISQATMEFANYDPSFETTVNETSLDFISKLYVSFKHHSFISMNRSETSTFSTFMASCGGIFGLFMGISVLSVVELIYYFSLRFFCTVREQKTLRISSVKVTKRKHKNILPIKGNDHNIYVATKRQIK